MSYTLSKLLIFAAGAAVGSAVTWHMAKTKYEKIIQDETAELRAYYANKHTDDSEQDGENHSDAEDSEYKKIITAYTPDAVAPKERSDTMNTPYVITPEEFGERDDYETVSLTYFADGILADDTDQMIEDVEDTVGSDSLSHFGEYEDDSVFVRNDDLKCDYEILLDVRKFADVISDRYDIGRTEV